MTIEMLQYFICTASYEHFSRAAQHLFISQPNLSWQIAKLEEEVGCKLFVHQGRGVKLTDAGKYFYEAVKNVPDLVAAASAPMWIGVVCMVVAAAAAFMALRNSKSTALAVAAPVLAIVGVFAARLAFYAVQLSVGLYIG